MKTDKLTHEKRHEMAVFTCTIAEMGAEQALNNEISKKQGCF
jgi:hypothetical protein